MAISKEKRLEKSAKNPPKILAISKKIKKSLKCDHGFLKKLQKVHLTMLLGTFFYGSKLTNSHHIKINK
jgi:hypothetical protein